MAPIGLGGHFPADISHTPPVDLFEIEGTNRAVVAANGLPYNVDPTIFRRQTIPIPFSTASKRKIRGTRTIITVASAHCPAAFRCSRPIPIAVLVGGIGVFFPGPNGYADFEQNFQFNDKKQTTFQRTNAPLVLLAEWMAFAAAGGSSGVNAARGRCWEACVRSPGYDRPLSTSAKIFLSALRWIRSARDRPGASNKPCKSVKPLADSRRPSAGNVKVIPGGMLLQNGKMVSTGMLVTPHNGNGLTPAQVEQMINQAIVQANHVRAAIRLPLGGATAQHGPCRSGSRRQRLGPVPHDRCHDLFD